LICKLAPIVGVGVEPDLSRQVCIDGEVVDGDVLRCYCPAGVPDSFRKRVFRVVRFLKENGIWTNSKNKLVLPMADSEEYRTYLASRRC